MIVRLGYVAISNKLGKKVTSSSTVSFATYSKLFSKEQKLDKLKKVTVKNFKGLEDILRHNIKHNIHFYRLTSAFIPLVTHPEVGYWGHREIFKKDFQYIGRLIKESNMRVDTHPDEFNVINSTDPQVVENTKRNLMHQVEWFHDFDYLEGKMVIHVGGATGGKKAGMERFIENFNTFPEEITSRLILENDDKSYTAKETLDLCTTLNLPMVLDVHHHNCNNNGENIEDLLPAIFDTWKDGKFPPKVHFSSPKDGEKDRKHADFINPKDFITFIEKAKFLNKDFDVMLECKEKDVALFRLVEDIKGLKPTYEWIDDSTFKVNV